MTKTNRDNQRSGSIFPDLREVQLDSFRHFLLTVLPFELHRFGIMQVRYEASGYEEFELHVVGSAYRLTIPTLSERQALYSLRSYFTNIYIAAYSKSKQRPFHTTNIIALSSIPLMTSTGNLIINGVARCIVSQLVRNPGLYYTYKKKTLIAMILCDSGRRFQLELDRKGYMWLVLRPKVKVSVFLLFQALELAEEPHYLNFRLLTPRAEFVKVKRMSSKRARRKLVQCLTNKKKTTLPTECLNTFMRMFFQPYRLGQMGRSQLNRRLSLDVPHDEWALSRHDIWQVSVGFLDVSKQINSLLDLGKLDDIDDLQHKHLVRVSDLCRNHLHKSLSMLRIKAAYTVESVLTRKAHTFLIRDPLRSSSLFFRFLSSYPLSQFLDETNPLADLVHKRKLSALGPGGLTPRTARFEVRDIHPSQYGRICPIQTAEGEKAGLVNALAWGSQVTPDGGIQNVVYKVVNQTMSGNLCRLLPLEEENALIGVGSCLVPREKGQKYPLTPAQHRREFCTIPWNDIHYRILFPLHSFSIGVSLIPFLEHNDATRALMGANMQRQAVPLTKVERPIVGTGMESQVGLDGKGVVIAQGNHRIAYVDSYEIHLEEQEIDSHTSISIPMISYERTNNKTSLSQQPRVKKDQIVQAGQLLADSNTTVGGELSLGKNILVAYMPWEGYNFEDAVLISERLINENVYTSIHMERHKIEARITEEGRERFTNRIFYGSKQSRQSLDERGIVRVGTWVEPGDILAGKVKDAPKQDTRYSPEKALLQAIFEIDIGNQEENSFRLPLRGEGRVVDVRWISSSHQWLGEVKAVHVYILKERRIQIGDKIAGRHGNKGVISRILSQEDMPYLQDGTCVDMILSPLGVPSRMNVGQLFESLLGLAGRYLLQDYRLSGFDERYEKQASRKLALSELHKASHITAYSWLFEPETPGKTYLFDGRTGQRFDQPVTIGVAYMLKLIHQVNDKIHARSTGPYALVTQQPVRGRARRGGQRVGEMEVWAFEAMGAAYMLQELLTTKSDHLSARTQVLESILGQTRLPSSLHTPSECMRVLIRELQSLGMQFNYTSMSEAGMVDIIL